MNVMLQDQQVILLEDYYHNDLTVVKLNEKVNIRMNKLSALPDSAGAERFTEATEISIGRGRFSETNVLVSRVSSFD